MKKTPAQQEWAKINLASKAWQEKRSKYRAEPTVIDGIRFASKREAARYCELKLLEKCGEIKNLTLQPRFNFPAKFSYVGDFGYIRDGQVIIEDVKGFPTPVFRLKAKCMAYWHPTVRLEVVK